MSKILLATLNDIGNVRHDIKGKGVHSKFPGKPCKQNTVINHEKPIKGESGKDIHK